MTSFEVDDLAELNWPNRRLFSGLLDRAPHLALSQPPITSPTAELGSNARHINRPCDTPGSLLQPLS